MTLSNRLPVLAGEIRAAHEAVETATRTSLAAARTSLERAREAGEKLIEAKKLVPHGQWLAWLRDNVTFSVSVAERYMHLAGLDGANSAQVQNLGMRAAYEATAPRRPRPDPPSQRGQPLRGGPDFWPTPPSLIVAACTHLVPILPAGTIWECACGDGRLERAIRGVGRDVIGSDKHPRDDSPSIDFLTDDPSELDLIAITNPPFNMSDAFLARGLKLLDAGAIKGFALLLRADHFMSDTRVEALNRAVFEVHCNWRPVWVPSTYSNPRWAFAWVYWGDGPRQPPRYLRQSEADRGSVKLLSFDPGESAELLKNNGR
jgi:hypothetical protein